jgi:O-acetylserine/cysteine efflux transporter
VLKRVMTQAGLTLRHFLLALAVVAVWGSNFVVIRIGLNHLPPLLFAAMRFTLVFLPAALFLKKPDVSWGKLAAYGMLIGAGQFGLLFMAMKGHISPGIASLVIQTQVFFTIGLSMIISRERLAPVQAISLLLAGGGLAIILLHGGGAATPLGLALVLLAALSWGIGNIVGRMPPGVNMLAFVVWSSLFAVPPLFAMSLLTEGWPAISAGVSGANAGTWAALVWQSVGNSLFGYSAWAWLMTRYPTATVAPMALLVPVFGMASSLVFLQEPLPLWKLAAAALVLAGLALNLLWPKFRALLARSQTQAP